MTGDIGSVLWVLMGTVGVVLLIACANVANLLLVRAEGRQQELAVRAALGADRGTLTRELLVESVMLSGLGGLLGLGLSFAALRLLQSMAPANLPRLDEIGIDGSVLLFTVVVSLAAGLLFGAIPALKHAGPHLGTALRAGGRSLSQSKERRRARSTLVVVQIALALVLLVSSGLMIRTFQALKHVPPGFSQPEHVQTLRIFIPESAVKDPVAVVHTEQQILDKLAAIPGVSSVGLTTVIPMDGSGWHDPVFVEDHPLTEGQLPAIRLYKFISPGLLKTMGNQLVAGRDFTWAETYEKRPVVMISENLARELWRDPAAAIGKRVRENLKTPWHEIIGVVGDEHDDGLNQKAPSIVVWPILMENFAGDQTFARRTLSYMIRSTRTGSSGFVKEIGQAVWSVNPNLPLASVRTLQEVYDRSLARTSFTHGHAGDCRRHGAAARNRGDLRRPLVLRLSAYARDRDPHGARRPGRGSHADVRGIWLPARHDRRGLRPSRGHRADPAHVLAAVRRGAERSVDARWRLSRPDSRRAPGQLPAGDSSDIGQSR